jgi:putative RNA 2'-phosphotransferase
MSRYMPKTLAKTLSYVACHSPDEYGLFWDADGTMPWKELYWALQEDESLRFVREAHIREIQYLGLPLPFSIDGGLLRLKEAHTRLYPVSSPPERLYYACRVKQLPVVIKHGLDAASSNRSLIPLAANKELALRIGKRRDPEPVLIECVTAKAEADGVVFRKAGPELYLVLSLAPDHLLCPPVRDDLLSRLAAKKKAKTKPEAKESVPATPGSFFVDLSKFEEASRDKVGNGGKKKDRRGPNWKRESRKDRHKRSI